MFKSSSEWLLEKKKNQDRLIIKITVGIKNDILQKETQHQEIKCSNNTQASLRSSLSLWSTDGQSIENITHEAWEAPCVEAYDAC